MRRLQSHLNWPPVGRVKLGDLDRTRPIGRDWGFDRGLPVDRHFIESFLSRHATDIKGRVLEVKDNSYTLRYGGDRITRSDIIHKGSDNPNATISADLSDAEEIPSNIFDCIICTQTLNLIYDVAGAVSTLHRILRPGGVLLATVPTVSRRTRDDINSYNDYWRITSAAAEKLFAAPFGASEIQIEAHGNIYAAVAFLHGLAVQDVDRRKLDDVDPDFEVLIGIRARRTPSEA
jgi:SAM-dependent methyltransferase